jgi:hypothetical protein
VPVAALNNSPAFIRCPDCPTWVAFCAESNPSQRDVLWTPTSEPNKENEAVTELPQWDHDDPLDIHRPSPGESARAGELWEQCLADDPRFNTTFDAVCANVLLEKNLPQVLAAVMLEGRAVLEGNCSDRKLMHARIADDVRTAREDAIKEMLYRDDSD